MSIDQNMSTATEVARTTEMQVRGGALLDALAAVRPFVSRRKSAQPHERGVLLSVDAQGGSLSCDTGAVSVRVNVPEVRSDRPGRVLVSHEDLNRAVGAYAGRRGPSSRVEVSLSVTSDEVSVTDGGRGSSLARVLSDAHMPPPLPRVPGTLVLGRDAFTEQSAAVAMAAERPTAAALPILTAVRIESGHMVATDRYRLANMPLTGSGDLEEGAQPGARVLAKIMAATVGETVSIGTRDGVMTVHADNLTASLDMLTGDFPKVSTIGRGLEESPAICVDADELRAALSPYLKGCGDAKVMLTLTRKKVEAEVIHGDGHTLATTAVAAPAVDGDPAPVLLNIEYLLDAVKIAGGEWVDLRINAPLKPVMVASTDRDERYCIIQPIRPAGG